tara:strand:- start:1309 stop:2424 length:1116 start_codon:yes stop_codon:yes gene_type:complete
MNEKKIFLKKILSYFPFFEKIIRKIYNNFVYGTFFIPLNLDSNIEKTLHSKYFKLNNKNFKRFKNKYNYFLISKGKIFSSYPKKRLEELINLIKKYNADIAYDGDNFFNMEVASLNFLENYKKLHFIHKYPDRFFYFNNDFVVKNIGSSHRQYNFNGSFELPSGGKTIGDGGDVANRLKFIPDLSGKTFLDIGSEEGYAVFNAIKKNAKFAKGLNIEEVKEYDFFPEHYRPKRITSRDRKQIEITQKFLMREFNVEGANKIKFEYNNIYNLKDEKFDFVFCFGVLYHLKNPYLALENLFRVTSETLIIETQGIKSERYLNAIIDEKDGFVRHSSKALSFLLKRVGFKKVNVLIDAYDPSMKKMNIVLKAEK